MVPYLFNGQIMETYRINLSEINNIVFLFQPHFSITKCNPNDLSKNVNTWYLIYSMVK